MVRKATVNDIDQIAEIYNAARVFMRQTGNPTQWSGGYPQRELTVEDIKEGKLYVENKVRGNKKAQEYMISKINETRDSSEPMVFIGHGDAKERAEELRDKILEKTNVTDVMITKIGPIIGTHTGPGMLAVLFLEKE